MVRRLRHVETSHTEFAASIRAQGVAFYMIKYPVFHIEDATTGVMATRWCPRMRTISNEPIFFPTILTLMVGLPVEILQILFVIVHTASYSFPLSYETYKPLNLFMYITMTAIRKMNLKFKKWEVRKVD
jgi:hypothetical protein